MHLRIQEEQVILPRSAGYIKVADTGSQTVMLSCHAFKEILSRWTLRLCFSIMLKWNYCWRRPLNGDLTWGELQRLTTVRLSRLPSITGELPVRRLIWPNPR